MCLCCWVCRTVVTCFLIYRSHVFPYVSGLQSVVHVHCSSFLHMPGEQAFFFNLFGLHLLSRCQLAMLLIVHRVEPMCRLEWKDFSRLCWDSCGVKAGECCDTVYFQFERYSCLGCIVLYCSFVARRSAAVETDVFKWRKIGILSISKKDSISHTHFLCMCVACEGLAISCW